MLVVGSCGNSLKEAKNAVKYISRNGRKEGNSKIQDLEKARQYITFELEYLYSQEKADECN